MKPCVFCGATIGRATVEHVIPRWARRAFDVQGPVTISASEETGGSALRRVDELRHLNITLRGAICGGCNNGFLSQLEDAVRPFLSPMMLTAEPTTLDLPAQALLATWAVKTVLLFELALRQKYPADRPVLGYAATAQELAWLRAKRTPPPRSFVWLGCWDCEQRSPVRYEPSGTPLPTANGAALDAHMTTFTLGFVAFQVFTVDFVAADALQADPWNASVPKPLDHALSRIWPARTMALTWPTQTFANDDWQRLVTWGNALRGEPAE